MNLIISISKKRKVYYVFVALLTSMLSLFLVVGTMAAEGQAFLEAEGENYFVASDGNDDNPGTFEQPWASIQYAAERLAPGETVYVRQGVYNEMVSIAVSGSESEGAVSFQNYPGETPILDGSGITYRYGPKGFWIRDQRYVVIKGFEIRNFVTSSTSEVPAGIYVEGASDHIEIEANYIHHIQTTAPVGENFSGANAYGLTVRGEDEDHTIQHISIIGNELADLTLGSSEALVLNGNVQFFTVSHNIVHDVDNIGIDLIGFEELVDDPDLDRARNGIVSHNTVYNVDSGTNPAYHGSQSAAGIYVDGGRDIIIEYNHVFSNNYGIEIASESYVGSVENITVRNNMIYHNHKVGLSMGGYKTGLGYAENCVVVNNTFFHNDEFFDGNGELMMRYQTRNSIIGNNIIYANDQNMFIHNNFTEIHNNQIDFNLYFSLRGAQESEWRWERIYYNGFESYQAATGNDTNSIYADPGFVDITNLDLHLKEDSVAFDFGSHTNWVGDYDIDGEARIQGIGVDAGADELNLNLNLLNLEIFLPMIQKTQQ